MLVGVIYLFFFFSTADRASGAHINNDAVIVFPNLNSVPAKPSKDNAKFLTAARAVHNTALRLLDLSQREEDENWVVSPLGLTAAIGQLMLGSKGDFHRVLGEIMSPGKATERFPGLDVHKEIGKLLDYLNEDVWVEFLLFVNSALFVTPTMKLKQSFSHALSDLYNADIFPTNFTQEEKSMMNVNEWVRKTTLGFMDLALPGPLPPDTASFFVNTVYFKGLWRTPFDPILTRPGTFHVNASKKVPATFMVGDIEVLHYEDPTCNCTMIGIPYKGFEIVLYVFLPRKDADGKHFDLRSLTSVLSMNQMSKMIALSELSNATLTMPRLKLNSRLSLRRPIVQAINKRKMKERSLFNSLSLATDDEEFKNLASNRYVPKALPLKIDSSVEKYRVTFNMGSASDDLRFQVDDMIHNVQIEMTEKGTEAVAITSTFVDYTAGKVFNINRPFMFLIRHELTKTHLFWGMVNQPE